jgi:transcriptional regulator with XRE-family HTH domain
MDTKLTTWLTEKLNENRMSMRELARKSGISHSTISQVINGAQPPTYEFCIAIAKGLGLAQDEVLTLAGKLPKPPEWTPDLQEWTYMGDVSHLDHEALRDAYEYLEAVCYGDYAMNRSVVTARCCDPPGESQHRAITERD